ncbi:MAG: acetylxylan esterase [Prolixibacteraceae bacterium]
MEKQNLNFIIFIVVFFSLTLCGQTHAGSKVKSSNPWAGHPELFSVPKVSWIDSIGPDYTFLYENAPYKGRPTRVYACYSVPVNYTGKLPAMVLVHGGGGKAYPKWTQQWAGYGYAAIAMSLNGKDDQGQLIGLPRDDQNFDVGENEATDSWFYHAAAAIIRAVSFLETRVEVDREKIGIMGISWGGFHSSQVVGLDKRLSAAVIVYGCGELYKNSVWKREGRIFSETYCNQLDPDNFLPKAKLPILWINNNTDHFFPLDSHQSSRKMAGGKNYARIEDNYGHGYELPWKTEDIHRFADSFLKGNESWPEVPSCRIKGNRIEAKVRCDREIVNVWIVYTCEPDWMHKSVRVEGNDVWVRTEVTGSLHGKMVSAAIPEKAVAVYLHFKDETGREFSSDYLLTEKKD